MERNLVSECRYTQDVHSLHLHYHNSFEMLYIEKGQIEFLVTDRRYTVGDKTLIFISNFEEHSIRILSESYSRFYTILEPSVLSQLIGEPRLMSVFKNRPPNFDHCFDVSAFSGTVEHLFHAILQESRADAPYRMELLSAYLRILLVEVFRHYPERFQRPAKHINPIVYKVQTYIEHNYAENISIQRLADEHYLSVHYLSHNFKELTGYSPQQYILMNRLACAKELLINTDSPVGDIAFKSGFNDVNNFIRIFKKNTGITPSKYRAMVLGASEKGRSVISGPASQE